MDPGPGTGPGPRPGLGTGPGPRPGLGPEQRTSDFYRTDPELPERFNRPGLVRGYSCAHVNPLYTTSNQTYGNTAPTVHHMPTRFIAVSSHFSKSQFLGGMFSDGGFNTSLDKSRVSTATARPLRHAQHPHPHGDQ